MKTILEKFGFDTTQYPPVYCNHTFGASNDGLEHRVDGTLRAQVAPNYVVDYLLSHNVRQLLDDKERETICEEFSGSK